jgi:hypothetical protein
LANPLGIFLQNEKAQADAMARSVGGTVKWNPQRVDSRSSIIGRYEVWPRSAQGGSGSPGGTPQPGAPRPSTPPAVVSGVPGITPRMANQPIYTGGGQGFSRGANQVSVELPISESDWGGVETLIPDNRLPPDKSPFAINWDRIARFGSRCVRRGVAKTTDDRDALSMASGYRGLSLVPIQSSGAVADQSIRCFRDKDVGLGTAPGSEDATVLKVCSMGPLWGRPRPLRGMRGPDFELTAIGGGVIRATSVYTVLSGAVLGLRKQSVGGLTIRYAGPYTGATKRFPLDPDEGTDISTLLLNRASWDGVSRTDDTPALATGRWFFTAWAFSLEGMSEPSFRSLSV